MKLIEIIGYVLFAIGEVLVLYHIFKSDINRLIMIHKTKKLLNKIGSNSLIIERSSIYYNGEKIVRMNGNNRTYCVDAPIFGLLNFNAIEHNNLADVLKEFFRYLRYINKTDLRAKMILSLLEDL